ncbi:MAG TPA: aldo/keto reductase [Spirochaetia bacterium]|nr:aldo/keto reductase [Spirochaetia bacterium]
MIYRKLGNSGLIVSALSLGTMQFGGKGLGNLGQKETDSMVRFAVDRGINFIDTADIYARGESETLVGNALKGIREDIVLATKVRLPMSDKNFNNAGTTRVNIMREIDASLRRLKTDYVDLYQVHSWDSDTPLEETLRALDDVVRQGKVRYIGLSNYLAWQAATALGLQEREHLMKYITAQLYYSLVGRGVEHEWLSLADYHNIGILVWSPLAGGFLSGKYDREKPAPAGSRFAEAGRFIPFDTELGYRVLDAVRQVAQRHSASPAQVSIAWLLSRPMISSVIIAARSNDRLEENIRSAELRLTPDDIELLDTASAERTPYPKWMVFQHDQVEDFRAKVLHPERFEDGPPGPVLGGEKW